MYWCIDTINAIYIEAATALNTAGLIAGFIINKTDFETTLQQRMDANIESYPPKMEDTIMKSTESYLNNNDTLEHYNGHWSIQGSLRLESTPNSNQMDAQYHGRREPTQ